MSFLLRTLPTGVLRGTARVPRRTSKPGHWEASHSVQHAEAPATRLALLKTLQAASRPCGDWYWHVCVSDDKNSPKRGADGGRPCCSETCNPVHYGSPSAVGDDRLQPLSLMKRSRIRDHGRWPSRGGSDGRTNQGRARCDGQFLPLLHPSWISGQRRVVQSGFMMGSGGRPWLECSLCHGAFPGSTGRSAVDVAD